MTHEESINARYVLVVGSANVDVSVVASTLPRPGETVIGRQSSMSLGGKGANQAVASANCGATTHFVGRVGQDLFGHMALDILKARRVHVDHVLSVEDTGTGIATICVDELGMNSIVVVPGANSRLLPSDVVDLEPLIRGAAVVVLQCEIPMQTVYCIVDSAAATNVPVILNPAPVGDLSLARIAGGITYLIPNETEATQICEMPINDVSAAIACGSHLISNGITCAFITLGAEGCVVVDEVKPRHFAGHNVAAIDTTGAGDAFVGCLAASLASGLERDTSVRRALLYSALSTTRRGAQDSYPSSVEFEGAWRKHSKQE